MAKAGPVTVRVPVEYVADMRAVVIVEFWARYMLDELPWGWHWVCVGGGHVAAPPGGGMCADSASEAWAWDIAARPRLEP